MSLTKQEITQASRFQDALGDLIDIYLAEGMKPETVADILLDESSSDIALRKRELEAKDGK